VVPDGNLFRAIRAGKAAVATGTIARVEADGVVLDDGTRLPADILVTATGLTLSLGGKVAVSIDGEPVRWEERWFYRSAMFSGVPNLAVVFGYLNASWTLRADMTATYACRVLHEMERQGADIALPLRPADGSPASVDPDFGFSSGYIRRAAALFPKSEERLPWRLNMDYLEDRRDLAMRPIADGLLAFRRTTGSTAQSPVAGRRELA
jgi:monooxygenase